MTRGTWDTAPTRVLGPAVVVLACVSMASALLSAASAQPGGFRGKDPGGAEFAARTLDQEGCPLKVAVASTGRDERGVTLTLRVTNTEDAAVSRYTIGVWVLGADGTLRGLQQAKQSKSLGAGEARSLDVALRLIAVQSGDTIVAAVQEATGATPWRKDTKTLQDEIRATLRPGL